MDLQCVFEIPPDSPTRSEIIENLKNHLQCVFEIPPYSLTRIEIMENGNIDL